MVSGKLFGKLLALVDVLDLLGVCNQVPSKKYLVGNVEPDGHCLTDFLLSLARGMSF